MRNYIVLLFCFFAVFSFLNKSATASPQSTEATATSQSMDESFKESRLPESNDEMWTILGKTKILVDEEKWTYSAIHPQEVKDLKGKTITISGFMLPLEPTEKFRHFLLSKQIPTCPFCPPGEPNEVIEVYAKKPTRWIEDMTTYSGTFVLINDGEKGLFFRMIEAEKK